ncbi:hypothetical protein [Planosporangium mesophilum]|nr:hypothetical protein [Planosporangium mesophilum]
MGEQEQSIQREERQIEDIEQVILARLAEIDARLQRIERRSAGPLDG